MRPARVQLTIWLSPEAMALLEEEREVRGLPRATAARLLIGEGIVAARVARKFPVLSFAPGERERERALELLEKSG